MFRFTNKLSTNDSQTKYPMVAHRGAFKTYSRVKADFRYGDEVYSRIFGASQRYTFAGDVKAAVGPAVASLAGIDKRMLSVEGAVNLDAVLSELRSTSGVPIQAVYTHSTHIANWNWHDNHVALLINALRAYHLKKLEEVGQRGKGYIPEYNDGHVRVHAVGDSIDDSPYVFEWPSGTNDEDHPEWTFFQEVMPSIDVPYVDLRGNSQTEGAFLLMMLARWKRSTNYAIDFDYPMLTDRMAYRAPFAIPGPNMRLDPEADYRELTVPTSNEMWSAIRRYVSHNKLYNQMYTAVYLLAQILVRPVANNAEGMAWTHHDPVIVIPKFYSSRGRYPFLNSGEAALIQATALEDWREVATNPDTILNSAIIISTLVNVGLYSRLFKRAMRETAYDDSYSFETYVKPETFIASAMAEATGFDAPLNGMESAYVYYPELVNRDTVLYANATVFESAGYDFVVGRGIKVLGVPLAVSPYAVYPLAVFDGPNPFSGHFKVNPPMAYTRNSAKYTKRDAWLYAWANRVAGYDTQVSFPGDESGLSKFYADNDDSWTHIPYATLDDDIDYVVIKSVRHRRHHFVHLPNMLSKSFAIPFTVTLKVLDRYLQTDDNREIRFVESGRAAQLPVTSGIQVISAGELTRYWGAVRRTDQGLVLSDMTRPAVVPDVTTQAGHVDMAETGETE